MVRWKALVRKTKLSFTNTITHQKNSINIKAADHDDAANFLIDWLEKQDGFDSVKAIGHRIVHGMKHTEPEQITPELLDELKKISAYDPEHLPEEIKLIEVFRKRYPALAQIACFDTSFHTSYATCGKIVVHSTPYLMQWVFSDTVFMDFLMPFLWKNLTAQQGMKQQRAK